MTDDKNRGLYNKYIVDRVDGKEVGRCFVLELDDPLTWLALKQWAGDLWVAGYENLANDIYDAVEAQDWASHHASISKKER